MGKYGSYRELMKNESEGTDYRVRYWCGSSNLLIAAPHGGGIEPGTSEIAEAAAGTEHGFYSFEGLKPENNRHLHIPCARFDEPIGLQIAEKADTVITVHGCKDPGETVFLGGRDEALRERIGAALGRIHLRMTRHPLFPGQHAGNLCNRSRRSRGVQLELSFGLRKKMFRPLGIESEPAGSGGFWKFVEAVRKALVQTG